MNVDTVKKKESGKQYVQYGSTYMEFKGKQNLTI